MTVVYKSSWFQTYAFYVIYPVLILASLFGIFGIASYGDFGLFNIAMLLIFLYCLVAATEALLKLRYIEVTEDYILIKSIKKEKVVKFKDVAYLYNLISFRGDYLVLWYNDVETGKLEVILVRPEMSKTGIASYIYREGDLDITKFIKERAMRENHEYLKTDKRRWFLFSIRPDF